MGKSEHVVRQRDECWGRYRQFLVGLGGIQGELLAAHLAVESELDRAIRRLLSHPDAVLENSSFNSKIRILKAVWPGEPLIGKHFAFMALLNSARNTIAHEANQERFSEAFGKLALCAKQELKSQANWEDEPSDALRGSTLTVCGFLAGLTSLADGSPAKLGFITPSTVSRGAPAGP